MIICPVHFVPRNLFKSNPPFALCVGSNEIVFFLRSNVDQARRRTHAGGFRGFPRLWSCWEKITRASEVFPVGEAVLCRENLKNNKTTTKELRRSYLRKSLEAFLWGETCVPELYSSYSSYHAVHDSTLTQSAEMQEANKQTNKNPLPSRIQTSLFVQQPTRLITPINR